MASSLPPSPEPLEKGNLEDYVDLNDPVLQERIQFALANGKVRVSEKADTLLCSDWSQATDRTVLVPLAPVSANKKKSKPKSASGGKRSRKELKVRLLFAVGVLLSLFVGKRLETAAWRRRVARPGAWRRRRK